MACHARAYVYIMTSKYLSTKNIFKIGHIKDIALRLREINAHQPTNDLQFSYYKLYANIKCPSKLWKLIHNMFLKQQCKETGKTEWFYLYPDDLNRIDTIVNDWIKDEDYSMCFCEDSKRNKIRAKKDKNFRDRLNIDPAIWLDHPSMYSIDDICRKFDFDIVNNVQNKLFWDIFHSDYIVVDKDLLKHLGYTGPFAYTKSAFSKLLQRNPQIAYTEIAGDTVNSVKGFKLSSPDFECILMRMRTTNSEEIRRMYFIMKTIVTKYYHYCNLYEKKKVSNC